MTYAAFALAIDRFLEEDIPAEVSKLERVLSIAALNKVVLKSPVDRGRFRSGWMVTLNERTDAAPPEITDVKTGARGKKGRGAAAANATITDGMGVIAGAKPFGQIFLQNNVEYGEALEDGGSDQAPRGMVAITVAELETIFQ